MYYKNDVYRYDENLSYNLVQPMIIVIFYLFMVFRENLIMYQFSEEVAK